MILAAILAAPDAPARGESEDQVAVGPGTPLGHLVPAKALVKPMVVHGPLRLTRNDLRHLGPPAALDESLITQHTELDTPPFSSFPNLTAIADGPRTFGFQGPVLRRWTPDRLSAIDPQIAVSRTHVVVSAWDRWGMYAKDGSLVKIVKASDFFADLIPEINEALNVPDTTTYGIDRFFDTRLVFDDYRQRFWVLTMAKQTSTDRGITKTATDADLTYRRSKLLVGVSATDDPTGDWYRYWWDGVIDDGICNAPNDPVQSYQCPGSTFHPGDGFDFSYIGISRWHFMASNWTTNYVHLSVVSADALAAGQSPAGGFPAWHYGNIRYSNDGALVKNSVLQPAVHHGPGTPTGSWLLNLRRDEPDNLMGRVHMWFLSANTSPPVLGTAALSFANITKPTPALQAAHPNLPDPRPLANFPAQYLMKAVWRDGDLYAVVPDCRQWSGATECMAAIRLLRFGAFGDTGRPTINVTFGKRHPLDPIDARFSYFLPSLEVNRFGDMAMVYHRSGSTIFPEVRGTLRLVGDTAIRPSFLVKAGEFPAGCPASDHACAQEGAPVKSIDNSGMAVDPFDDVGIWMVHAYGAPSGGDVSTATIGAWKLVVAKVYGSVHPDLTVDSVDVVTRTLAPGSTLNARIRLRNNGDGTARSIRVDLSLAQVGTRPRSWLSIGELSVASIPSGRDLLLDAATQIPSTLTPGRYAMRVTVDHDGKIVEYSESNNAKAGPTLSIGSAAP
jgi:hypothetical protein